MWMYNVNNLLDPTHEALQISMSQRVSNVNRYYIGEWEEETSD